MNASEIFEERKRVVLREVAEWFAAHPDCEFYYHDSTALIYKRDGTSTAEPLGIGPMEEQDDAALRCLFESDRQRHHGMTHEQWFDRYCWAQIHGGH